MLEYEPEFKIEIRKEFLGDKPYFGAYLVNLGKHLVRNVMISIDTVQKQREHKFMPLINLAPNERILLHSFDRDTFNKGRIKINIDYENALGEFGGVSFLKDRELPGFMVSGRKRIPGILLNSLEDLALISRALALPRRIRKLQKMQEEK